MARYLYSELSAAVEARLNCQRQMDATGHATKPHIASANHAEWHAKWTNAIDYLCRVFMPSGSGFDSGTKIDLDASHAEKLVFTTSYHHMNDGGYYDGWTEHTITVTPSFRGVNIRISGRNRNDIKDYMHEVFDGALKTEIEWDNDKQRWYSPEMRKAAAEYQAKVASGEIA